jgi:tRNA(Ile)-lysidine synthase
MKKIILTLKPALAKNFQIPNQVLCTVSGGQDSILTLMIFMHFQSELRLKLQIIHCHHFLQLKNFFCFWQLVRISYLFEMPISIVLTTEYLKNENQARKWRQISFERISQFEQCSLIVLGHTASDKFETVLSNLKRGTSSQGLSTLSSISSYENNSVFSFFPCNLIRNLGKMEKRKGLDFFKNNFIKLIRTSWPTDFTQMVIFSVNYSQVVCYFPKSRNLQQRLILNQVNDIFEARRLKKFTQILKLKFRVSNKIMYSFYPSQIKFCFLLARPLLILQRNDVTQISQIYNFPVITDDTNELVEISRNRLRRQILPLLRYFFSLNLELFSTRCLEILRLEQEYLNTRTDSIRKILLTELATKKQFQEGVENFYFTNKKFSCNIKILKSNSTQVSQIKIRNVFKTLPIALQRICLRKFFYELTKTQLNYSQIELLRILIQKN